MGGRGRRERRNVTVRNVIKLSKLHEISKSLFCLFYNRVEIVTLSSRYETGAVISQEKNYQ